nr:hypothetical protein [Tanacetum cinerariifolium]
MVVVNHVMDIIVNHKQNMEKAMLDLVKTCHHKQFLCMHDNVDDLIESALDSKLLSINSINSQHLDKKEPKGRGSVPTGVGTVTATLFLSKGRGSVPTGVGTVTATLFL